MEGQRDIYGGLLDIHGLGHFDEAFEVHINLQIFKAIFSKGLEVVEGDGLFVFSVDKVKDRKVLVMMGKL